MTDANKSLDNLAKDLRFIAREVNAIQTSDYEALDAINRAINDAKAELEAARLALAPEVESIAA